MNQEELLNGFMLTNATVEGIEETPDGFISFYIPTEEWSEQLQTSLQALIAEQPKGSIELLTADELEQRDWNAEWEQGIEPQQITSDLVITPSWKLVEAAELDAKYQIVIDPKMSFGTGHHETTRLCLRAVETLDVRNQHILDIGTGSGVLAIYALLLGAKSAVAIDTDVWSVENSIENRDLNNIPEQKLEIRAGELAQTVKKEESFSLIFANIHRNVLIALADDIKSHLTSSGIIILSGILVYDADEVSSAYTSRGFQLKNRLQENEWVALVLQLA